MTVALTSTAAIDAGEIPQELRDEFEVKGFASPANADVP